MKMLEKAGLLLRITRTHGIARRYFVVNGFDGALTMLGLLTGFLLSRATDLIVVISACLGAAIALGVSGVSSAYVSEAAERRRAMEDLQGAMITDLEGSFHGDAARWVPVFIAVVNGAAPLFISLLIISPLWLAQAGVAMPWSPLYAALAVSLILIFFLGVFLGRIARTSWWWSGIKTLLVALFTGLLILLVAGR
jgi:predicted membrane protein (TIGR00267 family)